MSDIWEPFCPIFLVSFFLCSLVYCLWFSVRISSEGSRILSGGWEGSSSAAPPAAAVLSGGVKPQPGTPPEAVWVAEDHLCPCDLVCVCKCVCGLCVLIQANGPLCLRRGLRPHTADLRVAMETTRVASWIPGPSHDTLQSRDLESTSEQTWERRQEIQTSAVFKIIFVSKAQKKNRLKWNVMLKFDQVNLKHADWLVLIRYTDIWVCAELRGYFTTSAAWLIIV